MTEHDDLIARLRGLGDGPVDPRVASQHLTAMAAVAGSGRRGARSRFGRAKIVGAFVAGLVLGGTSLASAGVMGETVKNKVADAGEVVGLNLPGGTERFGDGCPDYTAGMNRGQYLKQQREAGPAAFEAAKASDCGMPAKAVQNRANAGGGGGGAGAADTSGCKPPWAGGNKQARTPEAIAAHEACDPGAAGVESEEDEAEIEDEGRGNKPETTGTVSSQDAEVTTPEGGEDDNAGVPGDGSTPPADDPADEIRPDEPGDPTTPPSTAPAAGGDATTATVTSEP